MRPSRGAEPLTPEKIAAWEGRAYAALRAQRAAAASTPADDTLPLEPEDHRAEARSALEALPPA